MRLPFMMCLMSLLFLGIVSIDAQSQSCDPLSRLVVGQQGRVLFTDGEALNVRSGAGREFGFVGSLPEGTVFDVLREPICAEGIIWYEIQAGDVTGWSAEATVTDGYFVEPLHPQADAARAILDSAPLFDAAQIAPDTIVVIRTNAGLSFTNAGGDTVATTPDSPFTIFSGGVSIPTNNGLTLYTFDNTRLTVQAPQSPDGMHYINGAPSADGTQIAWLYTDCQGALGCASRPDEFIGYSLLVTNRDGTNIREIYTGLPSDDVGLLQVNSWRGDGRVMLEQTRLTTYPLPGTIPGGDPGYPPLPYLMEITQDGQALLSPDDYYLYGTSADGQWRVWPEITAGRISMLNIGNVNGAVQSISLEDTQTTNQVTFAPDSSHVIWTTSIYPDAHQSHAVQIDLTMMDVTTGDVSPVWQFYEGKPFIIGWLADTLVLVEVRSLTPILDQSQCADCLTIQERTLHTIVIDVLTGDVWRYDSGQRVVWVGQP